MERTASDPAPGRRLPGPPSAALALLLPLLVAAAAGAAFRKTTVHTLYLGEGVDAGDFDRDGIADLANGPCWFRGPDYRARFTFAPVAPPGRDVSQGWELGLSYAPWGTHVRDFNGDGWDDILLFERLEAVAYWYENPGPAANGGAFWKRHAARPAIGHETRHLVDLVGDAAPEVLGASKDTLGWFAPDPAAPASRWRFRAVGRGDFEFGHGLGAGDVDGDGRKDVLCAAGWFRQPARPDQETWSFHPADLRTSAPAPRVSPKTAGGSHMHAYDVDGDGLNDIVTALDSHGWGLAWHRQIRPGGPAGPVSGIAFERRLIMGDSTERARYGAAFSQLHALQLADVDGDGLKDIVTGKTWWAHPPDWGDPDGLGAPVLYVFRLVREGGQARFVPQRIDDRSGVGRHFPVRDLDGDGRLDILVANKGGLFLFRQDPASALPPAPGPGPRAAWRPLPTGLRLGRARGGALRLLVIGPDGAERDLLGAVRR